MVLVSAFTAPPWPPNPCAISAAAGDWLCVRAGRVGRVSTDRFPPPAAFAAAANVTADVYAEAAADPEAFWLQQSRRREWDREPQQAYDGSGFSFVSWFADGTLNVARNCVAVEGEDLNAELRAHVGRELGPVARPRQVIVVDELPKTRSGKIMRRLLLDVTAGREPGDTTSLVDPDAFATLAADFRAR